MKKYDLDIFYSDKFRIMLLLRDTMQTIGDVTFSPLLYEEMGKELHLTRQTISKHVDVLKKEGYIKTIIRGRTQITEKGYKLIEKLS